MVQGCCWLTNCSVCFLIFIRVLTGLNGVLRSALIAPEEVRNNSTSAAAIVPVKIGRSSAVVSYLGT